MIRQGGPMKLRFEIIREDTGQSLKSVVVDSENLPGGTLQLQEISMDIITDFTEFMLCAKLSDQEGIPFDECLGRVNDMANDMARSIQSSKDKGKSFIINEN